MIANLDAVRGVNKRTVELNLERIGRAPLLVLDANLSDETFVELVQSCARLRVPVFVEPTDALAVPRLVSNLRQLTVAGQASSLLCLSPNLLELTQMVAQFERPQSVEQTLAGEDELDRAKRLARTLMDKHLPQLKCLLVTMDSRGVLLALRGPMEADQVDQVALLADWEKSVDQQSDIQLKFFPVPKRVERPISASGAGDSFAAGFISGLLLGHNLAFSIQRGFQAAQFALRDRDTISTSLKQLRLVDQVENCS